MRSEVVIAPGLTPAAHVPSEANRLVVLAGRWLATLPSENTRRAYRADLLDYSRWCSAQGGNPLGAHRAVVDAYRLDLEAQGRKPATVARRLSALGSFYRYLIDEGHAETSPVDRVRRPKVSADSPRLGLDADEARRLLAVADAEGAQAHALACLLLLNGLRVSEALGLDADMLEQERGHHVVRIVGKGGRVRVTPLAPRTRAALDAVLDGRNIGAVFANAQGVRLDRHQAARMVARWARAAGLTKRISPHSLRHTMVTLSLEAGVPIHVVQDAAGHASPETTRRYDRARHALDGHATYALAGHLAGTVAA